MLGVLVGQKMVTHDHAFAFMLAANIVNIPLGCLAMQARPGCFTAERPPPTAAADEDLGRSRAAVIVQTCISPRRLRAMVTEFLSAFKESPAYSRMFLQRFVGTLNPFGAFVFYWYEGRIKTTNLCLGPILLPLTQVCHHQVSGHLCAAL
eukprot:SAG11_NODE_3898_length_2159_cov_1.697087_2_plen_150_part_00